MRKRNCFLLTILCSILFTTNVYAKDIYYENKNGITFTKEEYDFLNFMFWDGSQEFMTITDYNKFINSGIMYGDIKSDEYVEKNTRIVPYSTIVNLPDNKLSIVSSCTSDCFISVTLQWKRNPAIKSYDVIGAYLDNTSLKSSPTTTISTRTTTTTSNEIKQFNNGFGVSVGLPKYGDNMVINQTFKVAKQGTVYASYQHATRSISLNDSKNYTLSRKGYGGVFNFSGTAANTYDNMNGVSISL